MKYEMIFGNPSLFDDADRSIDLIRYNRKIGLYFKDSLCNLSSSLLEQPIVAMRRIIQEPKRWTIEDWKAGQLPEVGSLIMEVESQYGFEFVGVCAGSKRFAVKDVLDGLIYFYNKDVISPIETPEEKAQRLRSEWCAKAAKTLKNLEYTSTLTSIYDALLSGELTMPNKDGE